MHLRSHLPAQDDKPIVCHIGSLNSTCHSVVQSCSAFKSNPSLFECYYECMHICVCVRETERIGMRGFAVKAGTNIHLFIKHQDHEDLF